MLKPLRALVLGGLLSTALLATAHASVVHVGFNNVRDFLDDMSLRTVPYSTPYTEAGLSFTGQNGNSVFLANAAFKTTSGIPAVPGSVAGDGYLRGPSFMLTIGIGIDVDQLTLDIAQYSSNTPALYKIKINGKTGSSEIDPFPSGGTGSSYVWVDDISIKSSVGLITSIEFSSSEGSIGIDDLRFSLSTAPTVVPEPAGLGLVTLALLTAFGAGRRRKH